MKWFNNLKIATKLIICFLIVAVMAAIVGAVGMVNINNIAEADKSLFEENTLGIAYSGQAATYYQRLRYNIVEMLLLEDDSLRDDFNGKVDEFVAAIDENLKSYEEGIIAEADAQLFAEIKPLWEEYRGYVEETMGYALAANYAEAQEVILGDADAVGGALQDSLVGLVEHNGILANTRSGSNMQMASTASLTMMIVVIAGVLLAIGLGIFISRTISVPVGILVAGVKKMAAGDLDIVEEIHTKDEIGVLAKALGEVVSSTREQVSIAERLADADLSMEVTARSDKDVMGKSLIRLVNDMNEIMSDIVYASEQVASGAGQISDSSMALSQGATEQASSIEELTASVEEISSQTKQNAQNANRANELAETAKTNAVQGNTQMQEMLKAMEEINESSSNISKIIKVIDDIAFQTNMLALNAAVEAARAGQHGKGFAVVAEEVKNLAARSANAAKETTEMIESSIQKTEGGTTIAKETAKALQDIVDKIEEVATLVNGISVASDEQDSGASQISQGIMQVSQVVQSNSATSEESAAASEELSSQAELLQDMVRKFKLKNNIRSHAKAGELSPEVIRMPDEMTKKDGAGLMEFGKY